MLLSGYGVELAIKSTEYKAVDDTKVKGQFVTQPFLLLFFATTKANTSLTSLDSKTDINAEEDEDDEVQGFFFGTLK